MTIRDVSQFININYYITHSLTMDAELTETTLSKMFVIDDDNLSHKPSASVLTPESKPSEELPPNSKMIKRQRSLSFAGISSMVKRMNTKIFSRNKTDQNSLQVNSTKESKNNKSTRKRSMSVTDLPPVKRTLNFNIFKNKKARDDIELTDKKTVKKFLGFDILDLEEVDSSQKFNTTAEITIENAIAKIDEISVVGTDDVPGSKFNILRYVSQIFKPRTNLDANFIERQKKIYKFAATEFDGQNYFHRSMIMTIWKTLVISTRDCHIKGEHWKKIGFSSESPGDDLENVGLFGLLCMLFITQKYPVFVHDIFSHSQNPIHYFPFAKVSLQISEICLKFLKEGILNKTINRNKSIYTTLCEFYCGAFMVWMDNYRNKKWVGDYEPDFIYGRTQGVTEAYVRQNPNDTVKMAQVLYKNSKYASFLHIYE